MNFTRISWTYVSHLRGGAASRSVHQLAEEAGAGHSRGARDVRGADMSVKDEKWVRVREKLNSDSMNIHVACKGHTSSRSQLGTALCTRSRAG